MREGPRQTSGLKSGRESIPSFCYGFLFTSTVACRIEIYVPFQKVQILIKNLFSCFLKTCSWGLLLVSNTPYTYLSLCRLPSEVSFLIMSPPLCRIILLSFSLHFYCNPGYLILITFQL